MSDNAALAIRVCLTASRSLLVLTFVVSLTNTFAAGTLEPIAAWLTMVALPLLVLWYIFGPRTLSDCWLWYTLVLLGMAHISEWAGDPAPGTPWYSCFRIVTIPVWLFCWGERFKALARERMQLPRRRPPPSVDGAGGVSTVCVPGRRAGD